MSDKKGVLASIAKLFKSGRENNQNFTTKHYIIIVFVIGLAIMLFSNFFSENQNQSSNPITVNTSNDQEEDIETFGKNVSEPSSMREYEEYYENQLKGAIETIAGVGDVTIVVNVESTERKIYEKNIMKNKQITSETDSNGGKREVEDNSTEEQIVIIREGDKEVPLVRETEKPNIRGVLVVAKGAENIQVKKNIIEAIMRTLDVPSHRVSVLAKK